MATLIIGVANWAQDIHGLPEDITQTHLFEATTGRYR